MNIVIPDKFELNDETLADLETLGATVYSDLPNDTQELLSRISDADIITAFNIDIDKEVIDRCPKLKYIIAPSVGYEWIDADYAEEKGIKVLNCPSYNSAAVAEFAIAVMFAASKRLIEMVDSLQAREWEHGGFLGRELASKHLGLIGHGNIGKKIDKFAQGIGMKVSYVDSHSSINELEALLRKSDYVCICAGLNQTTEQLLNAERLHMLKPTAYLINVGRGAIVDQPELIKMLETNQIAGAALDVFTNEPIAGVPNKEILRLADLPNALATPHVAYHTVEAANRLGQELLSNIRSCIADKPINVVNAEKQNKKRWLWLGR